MGAVLLALARSQHKNRQWLSVAAGRGMDSQARIWRVESSGGKLVAPSRIMSHPAFPQVEGEGIFTYPYNPDLTRNFILSPARRSPTSVIKTISSSISIRSPEVPEDVIVSEIWSGSDAKASVLASMFRTFHEFWTTPAPVGEHLTWYPQDLSTDSFGIEIVDLLLPGEEFEYLEFLEKQSSRENAFLNRTFTLRFKIVGDDAPPMGSVTLSGI